MHIGTYTCTYTDAHKCSHIPHICELTHTINKQQTKISAQIQMLRANEKEKNYKVGGRVSEIAR